MIQFDIHRFGKLAKWSLRNDRSYFVRTFLQVFVVQVLMFLFFTTGMVMMTGRTGNYSPCAWRIVTSTSINIHHTCSEKQEHKQLNNKHLQECSYKVATIIPERPLGQFAESI